MAERRPRPRVFVVEDQDPIRELLRLHLDAAGFDVDECPDGVQALRILRERPFDLIVLDVMLPGLDGVSLCRSVRGGGPNADRPILMLTARDTVVVGIGSNCGSP